jgi:hypothetical protein
LQFPTLSDLSARYLALGGSLPPLLADLDDAQQALELLGGIGGGLSSDRITHVVPSCPRPDPVRRLLGMEPGASDVSAVLDRLLCGLGARSLPIAKVQGLCGLLARSQVRSVQDALRRLCFQNGRRDCSVTVGAGGDHASLTEAVTALGDAPDLDLALLPGVHSLDSLTLEGRRQLSIRGAGSAASRLQVAGRLSLDAAKLELEGLGISLAEGAGTTDLRGREIRARGCTFEQALGPGRRSWLRRYGGGNRGKAMAADAQGNVLLAGDGFGGSLEGFVVKVSSNEQLAWVHALGRRIHAVAMDSDGNVLVHGNCVAGSDLGDGSPVELAGDFVAKLDADAVHLWSRAFGGSSNAFGGMATDAAGNVVMAGSFQGDADFGDGTGRSTGGGRDIYVVKLDRNGGHLWSRRYGTTSADEARGLAVDESGNVYVCGNLGGSLSFGGPTLSGASMFILKLSPDGEHLWSRGFKGSGDADAIATDLHGNVVVGVVFPSDLEFGDLRIENPIDVLMSRFLVVQLDPDGHDRWSYLFQSPQTGGHCFGIGADPKGRVWITGHFKGSLDLGDRSLTSENPGFGTQVFLLAFSGAGVLLHAETYPGLDAAFGLTVIADGPLAGNVLVGGDMIGPVTLGGETLEHPGGGDAAFFLQTTGLEAGAPLVRLTPGEQEATLRWRGNRMGARFPQIPEAEQLTAISFLQAPPPLLALTSHGIGGWICDNRIEGALRLMDGKPRPLEANDDPAALPPLAPGAQLRLEGNSLHRIQCIYDPEAGATEAPAELMLRGNDFKDTGSSLIAGSLSVVGNRFTGGGGTAPVVAVARSGTAVYTGNQARNPGAVLRRHQEAGSADLANLLAFENV